MVGKRWGREGGKNNRKGKGVRKEKKGKKKQVGGEKQKKIRRRRRRRKIPTPGIKRMVNYSDTCVCLESGIKYCITHFISYEIYLVSLALWN